MRRSREGVARSCSVRQSRRRVNSERELLKDWTKSRVAGAGGGRARGIRSAGREVERIELTTERRGGGRRRRRLLEDSMARRPRALNQLDTSISFFLPRKFTGEFECAGGRGSRTKPRARARGLLRGGTRERSICESAALYVYTYSE